MHLHVNKHIINCIFTQLMLKNLSDFSLNMWVSNPHLTNLKVHNSKPQPAVFTIPVP